MKILFYSLILLMFVACKEGEKSTGISNSKVVALKGLKVVINAKVLEDDEFEIYYYQKGQKTFSSNDFVATRVRGLDETQDIIFHLPENVYPERLRFDFGKNKNQKEIKLNDITLQGGTKKYKFSNEEIINELKPSKFLEFDKKSFLIKTKELNGYYDPYFYSMKISNIVNFLFED